MELCDDLGIQMFWGIGGSDKPQSSSWLVNKAMEQLNEITDVSSFVQDQLKSKKVIYGYGHKVYKEDPRVVTILNF